MSVRPTMAERCITRRASGTRSASRRSGGAMSTSFLFEVDWANSGTWVDESARILSARIRSGFKEGTALTELVAPVGACTLVLDNSTQRYSPDYGSGPLYGNLLPRRPIRVR